MEEVHGHSFTTEDQGKRVVLLEIPERFEGKVIVYVKGDQIWYHYKSV